MTVKTKTQVKTEVAQRERMPTERDSITKTFRIGPDDKGYITVGLFPDGRVGEIFVKMDKQGSQVSGFVDCWAIAVSMLLQLGTPLSVIVQKFRGVSFEPSGATQDGFIAKSPVDYVCRWLEKRFPDQAGRA